MPTLQGAQNLSDLFLSRIRTDFRRVGVDNSLLRNARFHTFQTTALVISGIAYNGTFNLNLASGFNNNVALRYLMFFDRSTVPVPGAVPIQSIPVNPMQEFSWSPPQDGLIFEAACVFGLSTTPVTFTASAADLFMRIEGIAL